MFHQVVPELSPPEVEHQASFRLKRQAVLFRKDPLACRAIIHEAALHMRFSSRYVTRRQLKLLLKTSEHPPTSPSTSSLSTRAATRGRGSPSTTARPRSAARHCPTRPVVDLGIGTTMPVGSFPGAHPDNSARHCRGHCPGGGGDPLIPRSPRALT
ncbi:Scr1 family TA system antitoxin-like transcriptional regulator [Streptomyces tendae]|uniref:Scr1 family TA system antitoxin-like transcriptional regulator n=1 Tax=Streptomyces tendae TaxID=1932 RepID=UPI003445C59E